MSEPHELEERAARALCVADDKEPDYLFPGSHSLPNWHWYRDAARAVLNLVRQEQEKSDHPLIVEMCGLWWAEQRLLHTAKETSNG